MNKIYAADRILIDDKIITVDAHDSVVEAAAIKDGRFLATGTTHEIEELTSSDTVVLNLEGKTVLPGIIVFLNLIFEAIRTTSPGAKAPTSTTNSLAGDRMGALTPPDLPTAREAASILRDPRLVSASLSTIPAAKGTWTIACDTLAGPPFCSDMFT